MNIFKMPLWLGELILTIKLKKWSKEDWEKILKEHEKKVELMDDKKIKILLKQKELLLQKISNLEEIRANQENEIEEQEKIIELMAKDIAENNFNEDICRQLREPKKEECYAYIHDENACFDCVIEYFKKKARDEND